MKKFIITVFCAFSVAASAAAWNLQISTQHETEHVSNGSKCGQAKEQVSLSLSQTVGSGVLCVGVDARAMEGAVGSNKVAPRVCYSYGIDGVYAIEMGYQSYFYYRTGGGKTQSNEIHVSGHMGGELYVEGGASYNFDEQDFSGWVGTSQMGSLSRIGLDFLSLRSSLCVGYEYCSRPGGDANFFHDVAPGNKRGFLYYGWGGDVILRRDSPANTFFGVRYAGNAASKFNWNNDLGHHKNMLWVITGMEVEF